MSDKLTNALATREACSALDQFTFHLTTPYADYDVHLKPEFFVSNKVFCPTLVAADTANNRHSEDTPVLPYEMLFRLGCNLDEEPPHPNSFWLKSWSENERLPEFLVAHNIAVALNHYSPAGYKEARAWQLLPTSEWTEEPSPVKTDEWGELMRDIPEYPGKPPQHSMESIFLELCELIDELQLISNNMETGTSDIDDFIDDLECQSGTISTILEHARTITGD